MLRKNNGRIGKQFTSIMDKGAQKMVRPSLFLPNISILSHGLINI